MARAPRKRPAAAAVAGGDGPQPKTAVVLIHGIGEQRPLETLRSFVSAVYQHDHDLAIDPANRAPLNVSIVPDSATGSSELKRITTLSDGPKKRVDFFEFYWADIMEGTPVEMVRSWIQTLLLRSPWKLPRAVKIRRAWWLLWGLAIVVIAAGFTTLYPDWMETQWLVWVVGSWLFAVRPYVGAVVLACGVGWFIYRWWKAGWRLAEVDLRGPGLVAAVGLGLLIVPVKVAALPRFWAGALTAVVSWVMTALIAPYVGDVARYVRATPATVEKRRAVRERGLALLEALHAKRLDGPDNEHFALAATDETPLYDRIVLVGHSLGSIVAYDILQLFWEKYGPTHHIDWPVDNPDVQAALADCDAFVRAVWATPPGPFDPARYAEAQQRLFRLLRDERPRWRISDLITLGSPLSHADFLLADSETEVREALAERRFATSPPHPDPTRGGSMLYPRGTAQTPLYPHFAAQFAAVKWTNIFDEDANPILGDVISGDVTDLFGPGVEQYPETMRRQGVVGALRRVFTHTLYWDWDETAAVPLHIQHLRRALRLGP